MYHQSLTNVLPLCYHEYLKKKSINGLLSFVNLLIQEHFNDTKKL